MTGTRYLHGGFAFCLAAVVACAAEVQTDELEVGSVNQAIVDGLLVNGAGSDERWEGIVGISSSVGGCTGTFIAGQAILTAAHCFNSSGRFSVTYWAPTLPARTQDATVTISPCFEGPGSRSCDIAVVQLDLIENWSAGRTFRVYAGATVEGTFLHAYGYGFTRNGDGAPSGELRTAPDHASFPITSHTDGYFETTAHSTNICHGDSGGPAMLEPDNPAYAPIIMGVLCKFKEPSGANRNCVSDNNPFMYAKTTTNLSFIESVLGYPCRHISADNSADCR